MTPEVPEQSAAETRPDVPPRVRSAILVTAVVTTLAGTLSSAFLPYLLVQHPIVLLLASSDGRNLVLVAPQLDLPTLMLIAVPRRTLGLVATYGLGLLYGRAMLAWSARKLPRLASFLGKFERLFVRFQRTLLVVVPTYSTSALAGVTRTPLTRYLPWMVVGQVAYVLIAYYLGAAVGQWTERLIQAISPYLLETTAVCVVLVSTHQIIAYLRRRAARKSALIEAAAEKS